MARLFEAAAEDTGRELDAELARAVWSRLMPGRQGRTVQLPTSIIIIIGRDVQYSCLLLVCTV